MKTSEQIDKISEALAKAQGQMVNPSKNKTVNAGKYSYDYADLSAVIDAVKKPLAENGICHVVALDHESNILECRLVHTSGQYFSSSWALARIADPKQAAGNITYAKRYLLSALVGIAADEDKDGDPDPEAEYKDIRGPQPIHQPQAPKPPLDPAIGEEVKKIRALQAELQISEEDFKEDLRTTFKGAESMKGLSLDQLRMITDALEYQKSKRK